MAFGAVSANIRNSPFSRLLFTIAYDLFRGRTFSFSPRGRNNTTTGTSKMDSDEDGEFLDLKAIFFYLCTCFSFECYFVTHWPFT